MICNNCKNEVMEGAEWCVYCGTKLINTSEQPAANEVSVSAQAENQPAIGGVSGESLFHTAPSLAQNKARWAEQTENFPSNEQPATYPSNEQQEGYQNYEQPEVYRNYEQAVTYQSYAETAGTVAVGEVKKEKKVRKIKKGMVTLLVVGVTVIGIIVGGVVYYFNSAERDIISYINDGRYEKAIKTYDNKISDNSVKKWILEKLILANLSSSNSDYEDKKIDADTFIERASTIEVFGYESVNKKIAEYFDAAISKAREQFINESISYEAARSTIQSFISSGLATNGSGEADAVLNEVESLNSSREAFASAQAYFSAEDYPNAISEYGKVIEADANYETASQQIATAKELYKQQILSDTENVSGRDECREAIDRVNEALEILGDDKEMAQRVDELSKTYAEIVKKEAFADADKAIRNGDYESAIMTIRDSLPYCQNDKEYVNYWNSLQADYVSSIESTAAAFIEKGDYQGALNMLSRASSLLPENTGLKEKYETALVNKPLGMNEIKISESDSFEQVADLTVTTDTVGNDYDPGNLYKITGKKEEWSDDVNGYAKIYTDSNYKRLTGVIAVSDITENDTFCDFTIYGDDKILYTATGLSRTSAPISIDVDLTGISWIQIQITITGGTTIELLLSNFSFFK